MLNGFLDLGSEAAASACMQHSAVIASLIAYFLLPSISKWIHKAVMKRKIFLPGAGN